jgi:hypothetical protein
MEMTGSPKAGRFYGCPEEERVGPPNVLRRWP